MTDGTVSTPTKRVNRPSVDLPVGAMVGDYRIESKLGQGGMGAVYRAIHTVIDKRVALKVIHHELCEDDAAVNRFVQEARAVNRVGHPNIVDVFGFGTTTDGRAYLAMELLDGVSLAQRVGRGPALEAEEICDTLIEVTHALEAAHQAGIVHRDLKPDNVFLVSQARGGVRVKLLDFGIAKLTTLGGFDQPVDETQPGTLVGTPRYMAPEQARGLKLDGSADAYSLGVVAFELLTGRPPFLSSDPVELLAKHITLRPPVPSSLNSTLPRLADDLVGAMLEKQPSLRPSLAAIRESLVRLRAAKWRYSSHVLHVATEVLAGAQPQPLQRRRRRWLPTALAATAIGVTLTAVIASREKADRARSSSAAVPVVVAPTSVPASAVPPPPTTTITTDITTVPALAAPGQAPPAGAARPRVRHAAPKPPAKTAPSAPVKAAAKPGVEPAGSAAAPAPVPTPRTAPLNDDALRNPFDRYP